MNKIVVVAGENKGRNYGYFIFLTTQIIWNMNPPLFFYTLWVINSTHFKQRLVYIDQGYFKNDDVSYLIICIFLSKSLLIRFTVPSVPSATSKGVPVLYQKPTRYMIKDDSTQGY